MPLLPPRFIADQTLPAGRFPGHSPRPSRCRTETERAVCPADEFGHSEAGTGGWNRPRHQTRLPDPRRQTTALSVLSALLALAAFPAPAATRFWDGGTVDIAANGDGNSDGVSGIWNTTLKNWDQGSGLPHVAWVNGSNTADINGASQTLTLGADIVLGGIVQKSGGSSVVVSGGSGPYTLTLNITGANTFLAAANDTTGRTLTVNAVIAGAAGKSLVLAGPATSGTGTIILGRANTFSGTTRFSAGATGGARVYLNHQLALQNSTVSLSSDANLICDNSVSANAFTFGGLAASSAGTGSNLALRNDAGTPIALTVGGNNISSTTYAGVLSAGGSLIKTGSGILVLAGANTYTGSTTVSAGTLQVDGSTASPATVNSGATLAGSGLVNAPVTVNAGGSVTPGDGNLTVSHLSFSGTGTLGVGTLSGYTGPAAVTVTNALTVSGGAGAVTINLPTAPGFNGTYHLIRFGSGPANANGFSLGTVPTLAWNQTGTLQVNGNDLDYVITAAGDTTPPTLGSTLPANNATNALANTDLVAAFDETIEAGSGSIELRRSSDASLVEAFNVTSSPRLTFNTARLIIQPVNDLPAGTYYVLIPPGAVRDTSGNSYAGITTNTAWRFTVPAPTVLYTDTGSPVNPPWSAILPTLNVDAPDNGPVLGSAINVNHAAVETGLYGNRPISAGPLRIHIACNTSTSNFADFTRWFQTDGNTHMLRVFVDDENTATSRAGTSSHTEAFTADGWNYTDNMTYEWTARYTIARLQQGYTCFQLKNTDNDWAVALGMGSNGSLTVNNRTGTDVVVTNPDGSAKNFNGGGFDVRVLDDGLNYRLWIDGVLYASSSYSRPTGNTAFRWGMYFGANNLNPPADFNIILVSGAQVKSWPGNLNTATTTITKANNTTNLNSGGSWVSGNAPGLYHQALWNSTVAAANTTATLTANQLWAGLKILNPGGTVTINGSALLGLDDAGVDLTAATQNLTVNCPVQMTVPGTWSVAAGFTATFNGVISGYPGLTLNGGGTVQLEAANTYRGDTILSAGTLVANDNSSLSTGRLVFQGGNLSNTASCTLANDALLSANTSISVAPSQTLTLRGSLAGTGTLTKDGAGTLTLSGANTGTGPTLVSSGTLAIGNPAALLSTPNLTLADGTVLRPQLDGVIIRAPITVGASGSTATISAPTNAPGSGVVSTLTLRSVLAGSGNVTFSSSVNQNALPTIYLGAPSTYAGSTLLNTTATTATNVSANHQIILKLGINNALPPATVLTIDGGTGSGTGRYAELNLNGFNQQLAGLANIPRSFTSPGGPRIQRVVNSNVSAPATLTIHNSGNHTFSGNLGSDAANGSVAATAMPGSTNGNNFGLTKSGTGTFTLTGTNTYRGDTTVNGGMLSLGTPNGSNNASTITLAATGALLRLNFAGTDTVARLFIGTSGKPAGIYGHSSTGATNGGLGVGAMDAFFAAGPGTLTVSTSPPAVGYAGWALTHAPATGSNPNADEDRDGVANALEYVLGGTIAGNDLSKLPILSTGGGNLTFTFRRDQASLDGTTALAIETGTNLATWNAAPSPYAVPATATGPVTQGVSVVKNSPAPGTDTITFTLPLTSPPRTFVRLTVTPN